MAKNPNSLVPTLEEGEFILWESNAIVRYLCARYSNGTLYPADLHERAHAGQWMDWQTTTLWASAKHVFWGLIRTAPEERDYPAIDRARTESERALATLDSWFRTHDFAAGQRFTMGDIPIGVCVYRCFGIGFEPDHFPNLAKWYERLTERQAFRSHVMLPLS